VAAAGSFEVYPVHYVDSVPPLHVRDLVADVPKTLRTRYVTKGSAWKYEHEWRAIALEADCLLDVPGRIDQVIFGHRLSASSRETLRKIAGGEVDFFEAQPRDDSFAVDIIPADS